MGGSSSAHQEQKNTIDPMQMAQYQANYGQANDVASQFKPYTGQITAGFTPTQLQSQGILSGIALDPRYQATNQNALDATSGVMNTNFGNGYDASQLAGKDLTAYYNPFQKDVINASIAQNEFARNQAQVHDAQAATRAGSFQGAGTRQGVAMGETNAAYDRNNQQNLASLNSANFAQAQQAALADILAQNQAKQFNANYGLQTANTRLSAAQQLAGLNQQGLNLASQQGGILASVGDAQQAQQQQELSNEWQRYLQNLNIASNAQQLRNQALGIIPIQQTTTSDSTTKSNPGVGGILGGIASLGLAAATGGGSLGLSGLLGGLGAAKSALPLIGAGGSGFGTGYAGSGLYGQGNFIG